MKKVLRFSKYVVLCAVLSSAVILSGLYPLLTKGINLGIDFKPGLVEDIRVAPAAIELSYDGSASVAVEVNPSNVSLIVSGAGAENTTAVYPFTEYRTAGDLAAAMSAIAGVTAKAVNGTVPSAGLFANSAVSTVLSSSVYRLFYSDGTQLASVDEVRDALAGLSDVSVKEVGSGAAAVYQIRIGDDGDEAAGSSNMQLAVATALDEAFGHDTVAVIKTDYIGAQFSDSLVFQSILLVAAALFLIWVYATIRFKWDFALASVVAIIHDALIILVFITWSQMEFNTVTLAAILTIIGYGINDTVVVLDRIRENMRKVNVKNFMDIVDLSQSDCFGRTIITTSTTLLAVISLFVFTSGSIKDFALALIVGMVSSAYSTVMITSAFLKVTRRNWKPSDEMKAVPAVKADIVSFPSGEEV